MELNLESSIAKLPGDFLVAVSQGEEALDAFQQHLEDVLLRVWSSRSQLPQQLIDATLDASQYIVAGIHNIHSYSTSTRDICEDFTIQLPETEEERIEEADPYTQALHDWFVDNITHPFPAAEDMQELAVACRTAGLEDSDTASVGAWFLRQRQVSGWNRIADKYCGGDLDEMRILCASLLSRTREECAEDEALDKEAVEDVFDMCDEVSFACGRLDCEISPWVEALEGRFEEMEGVDEDETDDEDEIEAEAEAEAVLNLYDDADSVTSMEDQDEDMSDEAAPSVSWSPVLKRKREELDNDLPPRSLCRAKSASSSDSSDSSASFSSFSGSSASSDTSVEDDCDDDLRPTKRQRNVSSTPEPAPSAPLSSSKAIADLNATLPEPVDCDENPEDLLQETCQHSPGPEQYIEIWSMRKRKHEDLDDDDASQMAKRPRFSLESTKVPPLPRGTAIAVGATGRLNWSAKSIQTAARTDHDGALDLDLVAATSWLLIVDQDLADFMKWVNSGNATRDAPFAGTRVGNACAALDGELPSKEDEEKDLAHPGPATDVTVSLNSIDTATLQTYIGLQRQLNAPVEAWRAKLAPATELHSMFRAATPTAPTQIAVSRPSFNSFSSPAPWFQGSQLVFKRSPSPASTDGRSTPSLISDDSCSDSEDESTLSSPRLSDDCNFEDADMEDDAVTVVSDAETDDELATSTDSSQIDRKQRISSAIESIVARKAQQHKRAVAAQQLRAIRAFLPSSYTATLGAPLPAPVISVPAAVQVANPFLPSTYKAILGAPLPVEVSPIPATQSQVSPATLAVLREKVAQAKIRRTAFSS